MTDRLQLPGIIHLGLDPKRSPLRDAYVFDPHRLALPCWAHALGQAPLLGPAVLVTMDRHFDLVAPKVDVPLRANELALDALARHALDERNVDHILAAMAGGWISDAIVLARANPTGAVTEKTWTDPRGVAHRFVRVPTVDRLSFEFGRPTAHASSIEAHELLAATKATIFDVDLDCFTSPSDADPLAVLPWPKTVIRDYVMPHGSTAFWDAVLEKCLGFTFAREPSHCGGLVAAGRLFESAAEVIFGELLGVDVP